MTHKVDRTTTGQERRAAHWPFNVLQLVPALDEGGVERGTVDLAIALKQKGYGSYVASSGGRLVQALVEAGVTHLCLDLRSKNPFTMMKTVRLLSRVIVDHKIDIVHARSRVPAWCGWSACRRTPAVFITTCHGFYHTRWSSGVMGRGKRVITPSWAVARYMIDRYGVDPSVIRVIPRSVDLNTFTHRGIKPLHDPSAPVITIVGRLTPLKGHKTFFQAMTLVERHHPYAKILVVGEAPKGKEDYLRDLKALARRLGLEERIQFVGHRSDVENILKQTDVLVLASVEPETFGRVIIEAQAVGVPVVATQVGGVVECVEHERTGLLVPPKDSQEMGRAVLRFLQDRDLRQRCVQEAHRVVQERYTLSQMVRATLDVYEEALSAKNILVIKLSAAGDVVLATPFLRALRANEPQSKIDVLIGEEFGALLAACPYVDEWIPLSRSERKPWWRAFHAARMLQGRRYDVVVDLQNNRFSHCLARLLFANRRYGFRDVKWGWLLDDGPRLKTAPLNAVHQTKHLMTFMGYKHWPSDALELWPSKADEAHVDRLLEEEWVRPHDVLVGLNIGASPKWATKIWPVERMISFAERLAQKGIRVVLTGTKSDRPRARHIRQNVSLKPVDLTGKTTLMQLAALMPRLRVYVSGDSAPLHIASAMQTPVVGLFGPTDPLRHMPPEFRGAVVQHRVACAPCYAGRCRIKTHDCLAQLEDSKVYDTVMTWVNKS